MVRCRYIIFIKRRYRQACPGGNRFDHRGRRVRLVAARERPYPVVLRHFYRQIGRVVFALGKISRAFIIKPWDFGVIRPGIQRS